MRFYITIILVAVGFIALSAFRPEDKKAKIPKLKTYFACKKDGRIVLTPSQFMKYINEPICAKDENDSIYKVTRFEMVYAETGLYQDSAGLPIVHTDYQFSNMKGDTIDAIWKNMFKENVFKGDTIRFQNVRAVGTDKKPYRSTDIELILR